MNLKKNYKELYHHWLKEIDNKDLTNLNDEILKKYEEFLAGIKEFSTTLKDPIKLQLIEEYDKNSNYMLDDLLQVRETKILNSAKSIREIDLKKLTQSEKLFYKSLVSAFKGFKKMKTHLFNTNNISQQLSNLTTIEKLNESHEEELKPTTQQDEIESDIKMEYNYTLIRFIKEHPSLVGIDLKIYGPFQKEDIVSMPEPNAIILLNEKFAVTFEIN